MQRVEFLLFYAFLLQYYVVTVTIVMFTIGMYMRLFKTRDFAKWADKQNIDDARLVQAIVEIGNGLVDVNYGGNLYKKRVSIAKRGKSGGGRTLIAVRFKDKAFFLYGFAKSKKANISKNEEDTYKFLSKQLLQISDKELTKHIKRGMLIEIGVDNEKITN